MIKPTGSLNNYSHINSLSFKQEANKEDERDKILAYEKENSPLATKLRIGADKFQNALTVYPAKGLSGSRNANFYEFLTMGMVPYALGSLTMMAVFNGASKFFTQNAKQHANVFGRKMALGVLFYGAFKNISKSLIEEPIKARYGIDMNMPYKKVIHELPDSIDDKDLISHEYHKVFESVDFPRWDLLYDAKYFGDKRNSYYDYVAKKMGMGDNVKDSDQIVKPKIKEIVVKGKTFSTLSSYLWAAVGVGIALQKPWDSVVMGAPMKQLKPKFLSGILSKIPGLNIKQGYKKIPEAIGRTVSGFFYAFRDSFKDFYRGGATSTPKKMTGIASKALLFSAIGATVIGNIVTLIDFKKHKENKAAATSLIDDGKSKVVC